MEYGERILEEGTNGPDVKELQIRLSGFSGKLPDGEFGAGTRASVEQFQKDYMKITPTGKVDKATYEAIDKFMADYPIDFAGLKCTCGKCTGWGGGRFKGEYSNTAKTESGHKYEYPGMHRMLLFTVRALRFYSKWKLSVNSAYRCWYNNEGWRNGTKTSTTRSTTNHMGKAIDLDTDATGSTDAVRSNEIRKLAMDKSNCTNGWAAGKKALEPADIAPTWVHLDVREIGSTYLTPEFFVKDAAALDNKKPIKLGGAPAEEKPKDTTPTKETTTTEPRKGFSEFGKTFKWTKPTRKVSKVFFHCSDSDVAGHDNVEVIDGWHRNERGWDGIGYHLFVKKDGTVLHGRNLDEIPIAQGGHNTGSIAICLHGKAVEKFTEAQFKSTRALARIIHDAYTGKVTFHGHCEVSKKTCPVFDYRKVLALDLDGNLGADIKGEIPGASSGSSNTAGNNNNNNNNASTNNNNANNNNNNNNSAPSNPTKDGTPADTYEHFSLYPEIQKKLKNAGRSDNQLAYASKEVHTLFRDVLAPHARKTLGDFPDQKKRLEIIVRAVEMHEGVMEHMYVDSVGLLTVGIGTMIDRENAQALYELPFKIANRAATTAEREADKAACLKLFKSKSEPPLAHSYASVTKCRLDVVEARKQCVETLKKFEDLLLGFPNNAAQLKAQKEKIPFLAWVCMVDMSYGLYTITFTQKWPTCLAHVAKQNWLGAADESWINGVSVATQALHYHLMRDSAGARPSAGTGAIEIIETKDEKPKETKGQTGPTGPSNLEKPTETYVNVKGDMCLPVDLGKGIQATAESIALAYKHTEKDHAGGYFPLGANTVWHGGVHFRVKPREVVRAIADGEIVAARLAKPADAMKAYGSRNFILVRHAITGRALETMAQKGDVFDDKKIYHFYSLYMHLDAQPIKKDNTLLAGVRWLRAAGNKPGDVAITASVGAGASNRAGDVKSIQKLLIKHGYDLGSSGADGDCGTRTKNAIMAFQEKQVEQKLLGTADGRVDAGGTTLRLLNNAPGVPVSGGDFDAALVGKLDAAELVDVRRPVKAGEMLWVAGENGSPGSRAWMLHLEVFSEANLFPHFGAIEDKDEDFTIDSKKLIDMVDQDLIGFDDVLTSSELQRFYKSDKGAKIRRFACRFTTEWGANLDKALDKLKGRFTTFGLRERLEPYNWYTDKEVDRLKLPPRLSWHYNPITFIEEVMYTGVKTSPPKGNPEPVPEGQGAVSGVPFFCQADSKWAALQLNNKLGTRSIKQAGCAISSISMVLAYYGRDVDPKQLDAYLDACGGYLDNLVIWSKAFEYRPWKQGDPDGAGKWSDKPITGGAIRVLGIGARLGAKKSETAVYTEADLLLLVDEQLARGVPTVVQVRSAHYVVIVARNELGGYIINDPGKSKGEGQPLTDKVTQVIQIDVTGAKPVVAAPLPNYEAWTTKKLIAEMPKVKGDAQQALMRVLARRHANIHFQVIQSQELDGDEIYAEVSSAAGTAVSTVVSLEDGDAGTVEVPLAAVLPFSGGLTVKVFEDDPGIDDLITTFEWKPPFDRFVVEGKGDGAHYRITCMFEASAEEPPKAPDYSKMKSAQVAAILNDPKQAANHGAAQLELGKREVHVTVHVIDTEDGAFCADEVFVDLTANKRKLTTAAVALEKGQKHTFKMVLRDLLPFSGPITLRVLDEDTVVDDLIIEEMWQPPYQPLIIDQAHNSKAQKSTAAEYRVQMYFADAPPTATPATTTPATTTPATTTPATTTTPPAQNSSSVKLTGLKALQAKIGVTADGAFGAGTLKAAMSFYKLSAVRAVHFFAQAAHESGSFTAFTENLNYKAESLRKVFAKYFPDDELAALYAKKPEKIANRVYASRMGNGNEASGDGYKYRGRGAIQLTGKDNYKAFADYLKKPEILTTPDLVTNDYAFESAMFFFERNNLWTICDKGINDAAILELTKRINGGTNGLDDREAKTYKYYEYVK